jgi:hypothetical protein
VLVVETGLNGGVSHEIIGVVPPDMMNTLTNKLLLDPRLLAKDITDAKVLEKEIQKVDGYEFEEEEEMDVDDI